MPRLQVNESRYFVGGSIKKLFSIEFEKALSLKAKMIQGKANPQPHPKRIFSL